MIKSSVSMLVLCFVVAFGLGATAASASGKKDEQSDVLLSYKKEGVRIDFTASSNLNTYNNLPHTLVVVVYQLSDPNAFNQLLEDGEGLGKLLEGGAFDSSALARKKLVIQPSENNTTYMDRADGVRYLGIISGYFTEDRRSLSKLIPVLARERDNFFWRKRDSDPADTIVQLALGKNGIGKAIVNSVESEIK